MISLIVRTLFCTAGLVCASASLQGAFTIANGQLIDADQMPTMSCEEHFQAGIAAYNSNDWLEAARHFRIVSRGFPNSSHCNEALFYLGVSEYEAEEYDMANDAFCSYLAAQTNPRYFEEAVRYQLNIAEAYRCGAKKRFFGVRRFPKWASGKEAAFEIYESIITAMPSSEMAAYAMYAKGCLLWNSGDYQDSIELFQQVIRRFPRHELAPCCYVSIIKAYRELTYYTWQNPDYLALAELAFCKFQADFPREERLVTAEADLQGIKELYARGLYETGRLYERKGTPCASKIYYQQALNQFPSTQVAQLCESRLSEL